MGDVPDQPYPESHWIAPGEETAESSSGAVATADTQRWLLDQPERQTFVPSRREATAVDTYCAELCPPSEAAAASGEILETFTGAGPADLLAHTRVVAAQHTAATRDRSRIRRRRQQACDSTPGLLAARANNSLGDAEAAELDAHLSGCLSCQALELRSQRAERAFAAILAAGIEQDVAATTGAAVADAPPPPVTPVDTTRWIPDAAAAIAAEPAVATAALETPTDPRTRRRRVLGAGLACGVVVAATIAAIVLITGSNNNHRVVTTQVAAVHRSAKPHTSARPSAAKRHARPHKRATVVHRPRHTKAHRAATTAAATPTPASSSPTVTSTPVVSQPASTPPSTPASSQTSTPPPSQQIVSVQQPSLGAVSAPTQRVGSK